MENWKKQNKGFFDNLYPKETNNNKYTKKIETPIYLPKNNKPRLSELFTNVKANKLIKEIKNSNILEEEKRFLIYAAKRHIVFNYEKIADYYSHASKEMQELIEHSALVIIDFNKAIEYGYVKLCKEIKTQYMEEYGE